MYYVYVLFNAEHKMAFVGYSRDLASRLQSLNSLRSKDHSGGYRPWALLHVEKFVTKKSAMLREKELESGQGREFINRLIQRRYKAMV